MFRNNSKNISVKRDDIVSFKEQNEKFDKVVKFIQWSDQENELLFKFQGLLQKLIKISKQQLIEVLVPLKIDHELSKYLLRTVEQIEKNLNSFFQTSFDEYQSLIQSKCLGKVNLLMKTSSYQIKCLCHTIIFIHYASSNMSQYNKIIHWWEKKQMMKKLQQYKQDRSCIIKQKVLTIISILYIKYNKVGPNAQIVQYAINQRQKYVKLHLQNINNLNFHKRIQNIDYTTQLLGIGSSKISIQAKSIRKLKPIDEMHLHQYENLTNYLRFKLIQALILRLNLNTISISQKRQKSELQSILMKIYHVLTLINKFTNQVRNKNIKIQQNSSLLYFYAKMKQLQNTCLQHIKQIQSNLSINYSSDQNLKTNLFQRIIHHRRTYLNQLQEHSQNDKKRILSFDLRHKSLTKNKIKDELNQLFFKDNKKEEKNRNKIKSAKLLVRQRSKSKIMAKILSNTFENAKNALRKIQFEMKTSNCDRFGNKNKKQQKLRKKRKTKTQIYQQFSQNKKMISNICKQKFLEQIKEIENISINNPIKVLQDKKKCIIENKVIHRDFQQSQLLEDNNNVQDERLIRSEVFQKLGFIKIIGGLPHQINIKIKPKDKNYVLKFYLHPFEQQQFIIQISLPKSNNISKKKYRTIWPTIRYLLRKKLAQFPIFRQNQSKFCDFKCPTQQNTILQPKLISLFGPINEEQLGQISSTLNLLCKFFDLLLSSQVGISGRKYQFCLIDKEKQLNFLTEKKSNSIIKLEQTKNNAQMKQLIWLNNKQNVLIGMNIIKQKGFKINVFDCLFYQPFYLFVLQMDISNLSRRQATTESLVFNIKIFYIGSQYFKAQFEYQRNRKRLYGNIQLAFQQKILISNLQAKKNKIDYQKLIINVKKTIFGYRIDKIIRDKLQQLCWLHFQKANNFYLPQFFQRYFSQIWQPFSPQVFCHKFENQIQQLTKKLLKPDPKIKIYENILQFRLDEMSNKAISIENDQQKTINAICGTKVQTNQKKPRFFTKFPSINKKLEKRMNYQLQLHILDQINNFKTKQNRICFSLCLFQQAQRFYIVEVKFLTPFYPIYNWICQISLINKNSKRKDKFIFSALDLYSLGLPFLQSSMQTLKQIQKLAKFLRIYRNSLISKVILAIKQSEPINTSIDKMSKVNQLFNKSIDESSYEKQSRQIIYKFKSVCLNKKKRNNFYTDKPYFQTSGTLSEHKTQLYQFFKNTSKGKKEKVQSQKENTHENQSNNFLIRLQQYERFLSIFPYKFSIYSMKNQRIKYMKIYSLLSLKYLHFPYQKYINNELLYGIIQFQVSFSQTQYTLVAQVSQQDLIKIEPNFETISKKIRLLDLVQTQNIPQQQNKNQKQKNKLRRFSTKNKQTNICLQPPNQTERFHKTQQPDKNLSKLQKVTKNKQEDHMNAQEKSKIKKILQRCFISLRKENNRIIPQNWQNSQCRLIKDNPLSDCYTYMLKLQNNYLPLKIKLIRQYDPIKMCIYDVYMHSKNWQVGVQFNSGIGLGAEVQISKINEEDHFQIVRFDHRGQQDKKGMKCHEIQNQKILDLIKQYKLDHVDAICHLQPDFYTKNTILLIKLAEYFFHSYVKKTKKLRKMQI